MIVFIFIEKILLRIDESSESLPLILNYLNSLAQKWQVISFIK